MRLLCKLLGALSLVLCGLLCGWGMARRERLRAALLGQYLTALELIQQWVSGQGLPTQELLVRLQQTPCLELLDWAHCTDLRTYRLPAPLSAEERRALDGAFGQVGLYGPDELSRILAYYRAQGRRLAQQAEEKSRQAQALDAKLGAMAGGVVALLLL